MFASERVQLDATPEKAKLEPDIDIVSDPELREGVLDAYYSQATCCV